VTAPARRSLAQTFLEDVQSSKEQGGNAERTDGQSKRYGYHTQAGGPTPIR